MENFICLVSDVLPDGSKLVKARILVPDEGIYSLSPPNWNNYSTDAFLSAIAEELPLFEFVLDDVFTARDVVPSSSIYPDVTDLCGISEEAKYRIEHCGHKVNRWLKIPLSDGDGEPEVVDYKQFCYNRICSDVECQRQRSRRFFKVHRYQIQYLMDSIRVPKAWVIGFPKVRAEEFRREDVVRLTNMVYKMLVEKSRTSFSQHFELKLFPAVCDPSLGICKKCSKFKKGGCVKGGDCPWSGFVFPHFHCVSGSIDDIEEVMEELGCIIKYQAALDREGVVYYVCKYASKTPYFVDESARLYYHYLVYKNKMHKFSFRMNAVPKVQPRFSYEWLKSWYDYDNSYVSPERFIQLDFRKYVRYPQVWEPPPLNSSFDYLTSEGDVIPPCIKPLEGCDSVEVI